MAFVYLIEELPHSDGESGPWTKIGYSKNPPHWRMNANLTRGNPRTIQIAALYKFETNDEARKTEKRAHKIFAHAYHQKEWFRLSAAEIDVWFREQGYFCLDRSIWPK